jgi:peptidyl-prolyl cis-trans isomerase B (cyclophilin B)
MKTLKLNFLFIVAALGLLATGCSNEKPVAPATPPVTPAPAAANPAPAPAAGAEVAVITTSEGVMVVEFYSDVAPKHVENFKTLAKKGFYDGQCFHRVIKGFMIQAGDPNSKDEAQKNSWGMGGPGYTINAEFNAKHHARGILSMARTPDPNSAGSQFFICHGDCGQLDGQYTVFGNLIKGDDVLEKIATTPTEGPDRPVKRMNIESIKIVSADSLK